MTARGTIRGTCFKSFEDITNAGSKSATIPAMRVGYGSTSNCVMRRTPLFPARVAAQNASRPTPFGETAPIPVTTARRPCWGRSALTS